MRTQASAYKRLTCFPAQVHSGQDAPCHETSGLEFLLFATTYRENSSNFVLIDGSFFRNVPGQPATLFAKAASSGEPGAGTVLRRPLQSPADCMIRGSSPDSTTTGTQSGEFVDFFLDKPKTSHFRSFPCNRLCLSLLPGAARGPAPDSTLTVRIAFFLLFFRSIFLRRFQHNSAPVGPYAPRRSTAQPLTGNASLFSV